MPNIPIRFAKGQGLEVRPQEQRQRGLTQVLNLEPSLDGVLQKRPGSDALDLTRSSAPGDVIPTEELVANWYREDELLLESDRRLYSRNTCPIPGDGTWEDRGPWTRTRHRVASLVSVGEEHITNHDMAVLEDDGETCTIALYEELGNGVNARLFSGHLEEEYVIDAAGLRPRIRAYGSDKAFALYEHNTGFLYYTVYTPAAGFSFASTGDSITGINYDLTTGTYAAAPNSAFAAYAKVNVGPTVLVRVYPEGGVNGFIVLPLAVITTLQDVAIYALAQDGSGDARMLIAAVGDDGVNGRLECFYITADPGTGVVTLVTTATPQSVAAAVEACVICGPDDASTAHVWVEWATAPVLGATANKALSFYAVPMAGGAASSPRPVLRRAALYTQSLWWREQAVGVISLQGHEFTTRSGYFLISHTGEVVGRTQLGESEASDTTVPSPYPLYRSSRDPKTSLELVGDEIYASAATNRSLSAPNTLKQLRWLTDHRNNAPTDDRSIKVSAHGGYPRAYDGKVVFEHDWHELPQIVSVSNLGPGSLPAGTYRFALTMEWETNGLLFRSRASFSDELVVAGPSTISINLRPATISEKPGIHFVLWRTEDLSGGAPAIWYRDTTYNNSSLAFVDVVGVIIQYTDDVVIREREALDTTILEADGVAITDFVHGDGGRLYSRDPERESVIRYSLYGVEGFGRAWNVDLVEETPDGRALTAVADLDGSIILFSELGLSVMTGDGPDNAGNGAYSPPRALPVEIGCTGQSTIARMSAGVVYGSANGPRLLGRDLYVRDLGEAVSRLYEVDGQRVVTAIYQPGEDLLHLLDDGPGAGTGATATLVYSVGTGRWVKYSNHNGIDMALSANGERATLITSPAAVVRIENREVWQDGGVNYPWLLSSPWLHPETGDDLTYQGFTLNDVTLFGKYLGAHDVFVTVYTNYNLSAPVISGTVPAARLAANAASGVPYIYQLQTGGIECYAALVLISGLLFGENSPAVRLEGVDVTWSPSGNGTTVTFTAEHLCQAV